MLKNLLIIMIHKNIITLKVLYFISLSSIYGLFEMVDDCRYFEEEDEDL